MTMNSRPKDPRLARNKNVMVVGTQSRVEIWDVEEWEKSQLSNDDVKDIVDSIDF